MKIALLGSAPSSRLLAPFDDPEWEIWACSPANVDLPRVDYFFEIHGIDWMLRDPSLKPFLGWVAKHPKVYMQEVRAEFPGAIKYPQKEMIDQFGPYFWTSSLAYMMALAISQKPEAIGLWGVDMSAIDEYAFQRPGCHYYIQKAIEAGIPLVVPPESDIIEPLPPYGYREASRMWIKLDARKKELEGRLSANLQNRTHLAKEHTILEGALEDITYVNSTFYRE